MQLSTAGTTVHLEAIPDRAKAAEVATQPPSTLLAAAVGLAGPTGDACMQEPRHGGGEARMRHQVSSSGSEGPRVNLDSAPDPINSRGRRRQGGVAGAQGGSPSPIRIPGLAASPMEVDAVHEQWVQIQ